MRTRLREPNLAERGDSLQRLRRLRQADVQNRRLKYNLQSVRRRRPDSGGGRLHQPGHQILHVGRGRFGERPCGDAEQVLSLRRARERAEPAGSEREPSGVRRVHDLRDAHRDPASLHPLRVARPGGMLFGLRERHCRHEHATKHRVWIPTASSEQAQYRITRILKRDTYGLALTTCHVKAPIPCYLVS